MNRRDVMAALSSMGIVKPATGVNGACSPRSDTYDLDTGLIAACAKLPTCLAAARAATEDDAIKDQALGMVVNMILDTPPHTMAGLLAKAAATQTYALQTCRARMSTLTLCMRK